MYEAALEVCRVPQRFAANDSRVMTRFFFPGDEHRAKAIVQRIMDLSDVEVDNLLAHVLHNFSSRHHDIKSVLSEHYVRLGDHVPLNGHIDSQRQLLIGAYFTMEYAIEAAALFNPSIVQAPNQDDVPDGAIRFLMSLRATGEGHISSIVFRTGIIDRKGVLRFNPPSRFARRVRVVEDRLYDNKIFRLKLEEMGACNQLAQSVLDRLDPQFPMSGLNDVIDGLRNELEAPQALQETADNMIWLARSNYHLKVPPDADPSELVIFPSSENESHGIEDVRLVRFIEDDGSVLYFGTYTAYNGHCILPQIIETEDFQSVKVHTMNGRYAQNKGMALFPRRIDGWFMNISRIDGENLYLMRSDNIRFWNEAQILQTPRYPWEFVQIGNCGSPLETEAGWLLLTHGVGPMRQYCIGASLLDLNDPSKIIGQLREPMLVPTEGERDGYVPNVVYSCGALIHNGQVVIPYAVSDSATTFATVPLDNLLSHLAG